MGMFEAKVTSKGQITLPAKIRDRLGVDAGDKVIFTESPDGSFRLQGQSRSLGDLKGIVSTGRKISAQDIAGWIEEARSRAVPKPNISRQRNRERKG
jgi:AbrB family looped-hinge helix DNA binding protein